MQEHVKTFFEKNSMSITTSLLLLVFNVGIVYSRMNQMDKTDSDLTARVVVIEGELRNQIALEVQMKDLKEALDLAAKKLENYQDNYIKFLQYRGR
jgi:hypothetical protein